MTEKFMKKIRGENEIEAALQRLDRLTQYEGLATGAQTLQAVNKAECGSSTICIVLRRLGILSSILQVKGWCGKSGNGFLLQTPGKTTTSFMILSKAKPEHG